MELDTSFRDKGAGDWSVGVGEGLFGVSTTTTGGVGEPFGVLPANGDDGVAEADVFAEFERFRLLLGISESLKKLSAATLIEMAAAQQARTSILLETPEG